MIYAFLPEGVRELRILTMALIAILLLGLAAVLTLVWKGDNTANPFDLDSDEESFHG